MWKVALDVGLSQPHAEAAETEIRTYVPNFPNHRPESGSANLEKIQHSFAESLKDGEADAISDNASDDIRIYRKGQLPAVGKAAGEKMLAEEDAKRLARQVARAQVIRLISRTNMVNSQPSRTMPCSMESISASGALNQTALGKSRSTFRKARRQRNDVLMRNDGGRSSATPNERPRMIRLRRSSRSSPLHHASLSPSSLRGKAVSRHLTRNDGVGAPSRRRVRQQRPEGGPSPSPFRNRSQNQIPPPIRICYAFAIRP